MPPPPQHGPLPIALRPQPRPLTPRRLSQIKNAAAAHGVEVPAGFAAHDVLPKSLAKGKITPVMA